MERGYQAAAVAAKDRPAGAIRDYRVNPRSGERLACALANKLARICYATLRDKEPFGEGQRLNKKINRESFVMPA